jgi:hypothetical protein
MAYIGKVPTAVPLSTNDLADSIVTSAKITDGTIALADLSATGTKDATTFLRGDNTFAEAGGGGITEADQWRITAAHSVTTSETTVTNNWERNDTNFSVLGTGMTESSGIFTFPSTGIWYLSFHGMMTGNLNDYGGIRIGVSTDGGSNYTTLSEAYQNGFRTAAYSSPSANLMLDVDNVSNVKVRFNVIANDTLNLMGSTNANYTWVNFIRLGDT